MQVLLMLWPLTSAVFNLGLCEEVADPVGGNGEGDSCCHFKSVDAYHLTILKNKDNMFTTCRNPVENL